MNRVQSAVSTQVRKLEEIVGADLFDRGRGRAVAITGAGEALAGFARRMLALNAEALAEMAVDGISGKVRLGTTDTYAHTYLPRVLAMFAQTNPLVELDVICARSRLLLQALDRDEIDLALVTRQPGRGDGRLVRREPLSWAEARGHDLHLRDPLPVAFMPQGCAFRSAALPALDGAGRRWRMAFQSEGPAGVFAAVRAGLALTALPQSVVTPPLIRLGSGDRMPPLGALDLVIHRGAGAGSRAIDRLVEDIVTDLSIDEQGFVSIPQRRTWPPP